MIYADGMHGRFRLGYGARDLHVAAAMAEDRAEIDELVARGEDPNARDGGGCAPLHYAADSNPVGKVAAALFEAGADTEARDGYGSKPLDYAISSGNIAFIEAALDAGADPEGGGGAIEEARDTARYSRPAFHETRAYKRLMRASCGRKVSAQLQATDCGLGLRNSADAPVSAYRGYASIASSRLERGSRLSPKAC